MQQIHLGICFFHIAKDTSEWKPASGVDTPGSLAMCLNAGGMYPHALVHLSKCLWPCIKVQITMYPLAHGPMAMYNQQCNHMLRAVYKYVHTPIHHHAQNLFDAGDPLLS
jgi:hypothetical protein